MYLHFHATGKGLKPVAPANLFTGAGICNGLKPVVTISNRCYASTLCIPRWFRCDVQSRRLDFIL